MSYMIGRRELLTSLPGLAVPFALAASAHAQESAGSTLLLNAADSIHHYSDLLDKVTSDAFSRAATITADEATRCNLKLANLRTTVTALQNHLKSQKNLPALQERFSTLEQSLLSMTGSRPGQQNTVALKALPETLQTLHALMVEVSKTCDLDISGETAKLIDDVYSGMKGQNEAVAKVAVASFDWSAAVRNIKDLHKTCADSMDEAAIYVADGATGTPDWKPKAVAALTQAVNALQGIGKINTEQEQAATKEGAILIVNPENIAPDGKTAIDVLQELLVTTSASLNVTPQLKQIAYSFGSPANDQATVPGLPVGGDDKGLVASVRALVQASPPNQQKYFTPGVAIQVVNCIAVCLPIWLTYGTNSATDINARTRLIGTAIYFDLIWGTVRRTRNELRDNLQDLYYRIRNGIAT